jgi:hypothetical protein
LNGFKGIPVEPPWKLLVFSLWDGFALPIKSSSSASPRFRPQILHATIARPPRRIAPPIPTTTPMMVPFSLELSPDELPELPPPLSRLGAFVEDDAPEVTATRAEVVVT